MPLACLFCEDTVQTWYIYREKGKMRCTNCHALRPIQAPLIPEQCPTCFRLFEAGLQSYSDISRCDECFRTQLARGKNKGPTDNQDQQKKVGNTTYIYFCEFCQSNQVWINFGQFSKCEGCNVVGTHSGDLECACGEYDFLYTFENETESQTEASIA